MDWWITVFLYLGNWQWTIPSSVADIFVIKTKMQMYALCKQVAGPYARLGQDTEQTHQHTPH